MAYIPKSTELSETSITLGPMILVGGPSCVGKTAAINELIRLYPLFARPRSFTSRPPRPSESNNEYVFTTKEHISQMYRSGEVPTIDEVYAHDYAMDLSSISTLQAQGKIVIKEIHPLNHAKLHKLFSNSISVLILPVSFDTLSCRDIDSERAQLDREYYSSLKTSEYDIVLYIGSSESVSDIACLLESKITLFMDIKDLYPKPSEVHKVNAAGYSLLANEFTEDRRITTRNFHTLSKPFFEKEISRLPKGCRCAEVGPGRGWLRSEVKWPLVSYDGIELCFSMIGDLPEEHIIIADVFAIPVPHNQYDYILGSLIDPYCHPFALLEIRRILKPGGSFIFSTPSDIWASGIRSETSKWKTVFELADGASVSVFSFTYPTSSMSDLLARCGFKVRAFNTYCARDLLTSTSEISPAITRSAKALGLELSDLPVVDTFVVA